MGEKLRDILDAKSTAARVLLVEDEPLIQMMAAEFLEEGGLKVDVAGSANDALNKLRLIPGGVDAVIIDLGLPDRDGAALVPELRSIYPSLPDRHRKRPRRRRSPEAVQGPFLDQLRIKALYCGRASRGTAGDWHSLVRGAHADQSIVRNQLIQGGGYREVAHFAPPWLVQPIVVIGYELMKISSYPIQRRDKSRSC